MTKKPETVKEEDLIKRKDGLYYKKYARVPFTGTSEQFHTNGQLRFRGNFKNGKRHGLVETFFKNGRLRSRGNYKNGRRDGLVESFYKNGQLRIRQNYKTRKRDGLWEYFDEEGNLIKSENWNKGRLWGTDYWKNGKLVDSEIPF